MKKILHLLFVALLFNISNYNAQNYDQVTITGVLSGNVTANAVYTASSVDIPSLAYVRASVIGGPATGIFRFVNDNIQFETSSGGTATIRY